MSPSTQGPWFLLLTPAQLTGVVTEGLDEVGGPVVALEDATFADADAARAAFGHPDPAPGAGGFADFLVIPALPGVEVQDGVLAPTRAPSGSALWRLEADGRRRVISYYDTPAYGWRNGRGDVRPAPHVGLRARHLPSGHEYVAAFEDGVEGVHLVAVTAPGEDPPEGFTWTKVGVSRRTVPLADVELYDAATGAPFVLPA